MPKKTERDAEMMAAFKGGESVKSLADRFDISRERVRQIVLKPERRERRQLAAAVQRALDDDVATQVAAQQAALDVEASGYFACNYARYLAKDKPQFDGIQAWVTAGRPAE